MGIKTTHRYACDQEGCDATEEFEDTVLCNWTITTEWIDDGETITPKRLIFCPEHAKEEAPFRPAKLGPKALWKHRDDGMIGLDLSNDGDFTIEPEGIIKKSHTENGIRVIDEMEMTGYSVVGKTEGKKDDD